MKKRNSGHSSANPIENYSAFKTGNSTLLRDESLGDERNDHILMDYGW
jgi:hypothetical protein